MLKKIWTEQIRINWIVNIDPVFRIFLNIFQTTSRKRTSRETGTSLKKILKLVKDRYIKNVFLIIIIIIKKWRVEGNKIFLYIEKGCRTWAERIGTQVNF